jgi:hypothetical protein
MILPYSQFSHAEQYDDPQCFSVCDDTYNKCIANVVNQPEPRTYEEQQTLDVCRQTYSDCQHSCETANKPLENQPKEEESK